MRGIQPRQLPLSKPSSLQNLLYSSTALRNQPFFLFAHFASLFNFCAISERNNFNPFFLL